MIHRMAMILLLPVIAGCSTAMPRVFDPATIEKEVSRSDFVFTEFSLLKWKVLEGWTNNPGHVYEALLIAKHEGQWALVNVWRNALDDNRERRWYFNGVCHGGYKATMFFTELPTESDLRTFERTTWWDNKGDTNLWLATDACRVVASGIDLRNMGTFIRKGRP